MTDSFNQTYRYLDSETDREKLLEDIRRVRKAVLEMTEIVPESKWYEPRYHGWSLAAMLGHLQFMDNVHLLAIQMALLGIRLPVPISMLDNLNDFMANVFKKRLVETTTGGIQSKEAKIADFILNLPIDKFTIQVYYPPYNKYLTVEQAVQVLFLYHWHDHLKTMRDSEGMHYEPPGETSA